MKYEVTICITYSIEDASSKWDAIEQAERMFSCDTHPSYDIDINPIIDDEEED